MRVEGFAMRTGIGEATPTGLNPKFESQPIRQAVGPDPDQPSLFDVDAHFTGKTWMHPWLGLGEIGVNLEHVLAFLGHAERNDAGDFEFVVLVGGAWGG